MVHLLSCGDTDLGKQTKKIDNEAALFWLQVLGKMWEVAGRTGISPSAIWRWI